MSLTKKDEEKSREDLVREVDRLRQRVAELEAAEKDCKRAVEALRKSEQRYGELVRESPDAIISLDKDGNFLSFNPSAERISGFSSEEVIGKHFAAVGILAQQSIPTALKEFALVTSGVKRPPFELVINFKEKNQLFMEANPRLVRHEEEREWVEVTLRNISERKKAEEERKKWERQFRHAHKMEALGTLAGGIAHEFNNILGTIVGFTELTIDSLPAESKARSNLGRVISASNRAAEMVKQILFFSRKDEKERS